jgi:hypothetical protein
MEQQHHAASVVASAGADGRSCASRQAGSRRYGCALALAAAAAAAAAVSSAYGRAHSDCIAAPGTVADERTAVACTADADPGADQCTPVSVVASGA